MITVDEIITDKSHIAQLISWKNSKKVELFYIARNIGYDGKTSWDIVDAIFPRSEIDKT